MEPTLEAGLQRLYGDPVIASAPAMPVLDGTAPATDGQTERMREARDLFQQVEEALRQGDFSTFGSRFSELAELLGEPEAAPAPDDIPVEPTGGNGASPNTSSPRDEAPGNEADVGTERYGGTINVDLEALRNAPDQR